MPTFNSRQTIHFAEGARALRESIEPQPFMQFMLNAINKVTDAKDFVSAHFCLIYIAEKVAVPYLVNKEDSLSEMTEGIKLVAELYDHDDFYEHIAKALEGLGISMKDIVWSTDEIAQYLQGFQSLLHVSEALVKADQSQPKE